MSQTTKILEILKREGSISNFYCVENKITLRLASRIFDLRKLGYQIEAEQKADGNCIYTLVEGSKMPLEGKKDNNKALSPLPCFEESIGAYNTLFKLK